MSLVTADAIGVTEYFYIVGDAGSGAPGDPITGLLYSDIETGGSASYMRQGAARVDLTLVTQTVAGAHTDGGFVEVDATNMPGVYRCDFPDAAFIAGVDLVTLQIVIAAANNALAAPIRLDIVDFATRAQVDALGSGVGGVSNIPATFDNTTRDTIDNAGAADKGGGLVGIPVSGHAFTAGKEVTIAGTTSYNGVFDIVSQTTDEVVITASFTPEAFGGSETIVSSIKGVIFVGTITSGTFVNTEGKDGTSHEMDDDSNVIDIIYGFDVGGGRTGSFANYLGNLNGNNDQLAFQVYDPVGDDWDTIETILGTGGSSEQAFEPPMLLRHTGTGTELGLIYIRAVRLTSSPNSLAINLLQVGAAANALSSGYPDGRIHIDTNLSNTNTEPNVDGTATTPVSTMAALVTLAGLTSLSDVHVINGSSIVLASSFDNRSFFGDNWILQLGGRSVAGALFQGANVTGICTAAAEVHFKGCEFGTASVQLGHFDFCTFAGTLTMTLAGDYNYHDCKSQVAGAGSPTFAKTAGQAITAQWRNWQGGITLSGLEVGDTLTIGGRLGTVDLGSPAGAVAIEIRGSYKEITNVGSAVVDIGGAMQVEALVDDIWDEPITGAAHGIATSAARRLLDLSSLIIRSDTAQGAGTGDNQIQLDTGASAVDGAYDPSIVAIVGGTGMGQARLILEYDGGTKTATVDRGWKVNPAADSDFILISDAGREHVNEGLARAGGGPSSIKLNALASSQDNAYVGQTIFVRSGTGEDQARWVSAYNGTTKIATVDRAWDVEPDTTSAYVMLPTSVFSGPRLAAAVWNAVRASYDVADSFGEAVGAIKTQTDKLIFTKAGEVDANAKSFNDAEVVGDGNAVPWDGA